MRKLSVRMRITAWFSGILALMVALAFLVVFFVSEAVLQKGVRDNLTETVEDNVDEIEYFSSLQELLQSRDVDLYMRFRDGYLEIDDDFLDRVNGIHTGLYQEDGTLLYGENPLGRAGLRLSFSDSTMQRLTLGGREYSLLGRRFTVGGEGYYLFDRMLEREGLEGLWLRGIVAESQGAVQHNAIVRLSLIMMLVLSVPAVLQGYMIAGRALKPVKEMESAARAICQGKDLKKRIELSPGTDELHRLAETFNGMLERLDKAFEAEQRFISDASHELRTPMSVIEAQCEYILEEARSAGEYEEALTVVRRQSRKLSRLISVLLDFTRLERKSDYYVKKSVDMTELTVSVCTDMALLRENGIGLQCEAAEGIRMEGNEELLARLLANLIGNAYRYGREEGHIYVRLQEEGGEIRLSVEDDGIGIPEEEQEKIFHRFYRADASRSTEGTGLGLSMVKEIAAFHGGEVRVESVPGKGSIFTIIFPL